MLDAVNHAGVCFLDFQNEEVLACVKWCCWAADAHADAHADTAAAADAAADAANADAGR